MLASAEDETTASAKTFSPKIMNCLYIFSSCKNFVNSLGYLCLSLIYLRGNSTFFFRVMDTSPARSQYGGHLFQIFLHFIG